MALSSPSLAGQTVKLSSSTSNLLGEGRVTMRKTATKSKTVSSGSPWYGANCVKFLGPFSGEAPSYHAQTATKSKTVSSGSPWYGAESFPGIIVGTLLDYQRIPRLLPKTVSLRSSIPDGPCLGLGALGCVFPELLTRNGVKFGEAVWFKGSPILVLDLPKFIEDPLFHTFPLSSFLVEKDYQSSATSSTSPPFTCSTRPSGWECREIQGYIWEKN